MRCESLALKKSVTDWREALKTLPCDINHLELKFMTNSVENRHGYGKNLNLVQVQKWSFALETAPALEPDLVYLLR